MVVVRAEKSLASKKLERKARRGASGRRASETPRSKLCGDTTSQRSKTDTKTSASQQSASPCRSFAACYAKLPAQSSGSFHDHCPALRIRLRLSRSALRRARSPTHGPSRSTLTFDGHIYGIARLRIAALA